MSSLIQPICYPQPYYDESPVGYLIRVCEANKFMNIRWLYSQDGETFSVHPINILRNLVDTHWTGFEELEAHLQPFCTLHINELNYTVLRYCPKCLQEEQYFRVHWYLRGAVACDKHRCWLVDICSECGNEFTYSRMSSVCKCRCGHRLSETPTYTVSDSVLRYQQFLNGADTYFKAEDFWLSDYLNPSEFSLNARAQLVRAFLQWQPVAGNLFSKSGTLSGTSSLATFRPYALSVADVIFSDNGAFDTFLRHLHHHVYPSQEEGDRLFKRFYKFFFHLIGTRVPPLYDVVEEYLHQYWYYGLSQKNTLFSDSLIDSHCWIPLQAACKRFDINKSDLVRGIESKAVSAKVKRYEGSGRTFTLVYSPSLQKYIDQLNDQVNGITAASILGVTKKQLYQLLDSDYLHGTPPSDETGSLWRIEHAALDSLIDRFTRSAAVLEDVYVPLPEALRKIGNRIHNPLVKLLSAIEAGEVGVKTDLKLIGLRRICVSEKDLMDWYQGQFEEDGFYSTNQLMAALDIPYPLIAQLIDNGILQAVNIRSGRERRISSRSVMQFKERYATLSKLARSCGMNLHQMSSVLSSNGVYPIDHKVPSEQRFLSRLYYRHELLQVKEIVEVVAAMMDWDYTV